MQKCQQKRKQYNLPSDKKEYNLHPDNQKGLKITNCDRILLPFLMRAISWKLVANCFTNIIISRVIQNQLCNCCHGNILLIRCIKLKSNFQKLPHTYCYHFYITKPTELPFPSKLILFIPGVIATTHITKSKTFSPFHSFFGG